MIVLDASVAAKAYLEEAGSDAAIALLTGERKLVAPQLIRIEVAAALCRRVTKGELDADEAKLRCAHWLARLKEGLFTLTPDADLLSDAIELATELGHALQVASIWRQLGDSTSRSSPPIEVFGSGLLRSTSASRSCPAAKATETGWVCMHDEQTQSGGMMETATPTTADRNHSATGTVPNVIAAAGDQAVAAYVRLPRGGTMGVRTRAASIVTTPADFSAGPANAAWRLRQSSPPTWRSTPRRWSGLDQRLGGVHLSHARARHLSLAGQLACACARALSPHLAQVASGPPPMKLYPEPPMPETLDEWQAAVDAAEALLRTRQHEAIWADRRRPGHGPGPLRGASCPRASSGDYAARLTR